MMIEQAESAEREKQRAYWLNRNSEPPLRNSVIELLSRRAAPLTAVPRLEMREWRLPERVCQDMLRVCNNSDLSLYILLLTMFKAVGARCTGETEMTILSPSYRRGDVETEADIVMFQDHILLADDIRSNTLETRRTVVRAYSNQSIPLAEIHGSRLARKIVRNHPLCVFNNIHSLDAGTHSSPLELRFTRNGQEIVCSATYDCARLRADLVSEFCSNLEQFIEAASSDYTISAAAVEWLRGERLQRISELSRGPIVSTPDATLDELFSAQARKTPSAKALVHGARTVTYAELDAMAEVAAQNLKEMGLEPGDSVALRMRTGIETVAIQLAVLRSGAAFAPISPSEPPKRLRRLLEKARPKLLVTTQGEPDVGADVRTVATPDLLHRRDRALAECPPSVARTDTPAYVIFTSGTTGEPKGVVVEHRGIVNAVTWKIREYAYSTGHRVLPLFGYEFDGFVLEVFAPLCSGATAILMDDEERRVPKWIADCIESQEVTHFVSAPLLYRAVLDHITKDQFRSLRRVSLAGEAADPETIARSKCLFPHIKVSNLYGPTEGSVISTYFEDMTADSVNVIGKPIENVNLYILDERGNLVPPGVVGEIFLGGRGLARGYVSDASITQESFINYKGDRLYQTGDLGCWLSDGNIEFRGRGTGYAKMLGQRIDLREIRAAISNSPGVKDAYVLCVGDTNAPLLCAYVVVDSQMALNSIETFLRQELPPHMIPNRFISVEKLPLNAGGKVDAAALRAKLRKTAGEERGRPSNDVEQQLVDIWRRVLESEWIGIDDSFFSLGGHSLRAVRLLTEIYEVFGVELRLDQIFSANTVRRLAEIIAPQVREHLEPASDPFAEGSAGGECSLSSAQERMLTLTDEHRMSYNLPILFSLDANLDVPRLQNALQAVLERHDSLRASFHFLSDRWIQRFNDTLSVKITECALAHDVDIEGAVQSTLGSFDLEKAPLFRVVLFTVKGGHAYLLFDFHHIIIDEVSLAIVLRELVMFYNGELVHKVSSHSYAEYARTQQRRRASEDYRTQVAAAAAKLQDADLEPLRLPFDLPAPRRRSHTGGLIRRALSNELIAAARQISARYEVTDFMFFMALYGILLKKYSHQSTMVIGAPASLRSNASSRDLVGLCLNTVPFKVVVPSAATFEEYLRGVSAGIIDDLGRSQIEFDDVIRTLQPERHFGENPLFSVMLNIIDASVTRLSFNDVRATYIPIHNGTSKFDLILELDLAEQDSSFSFEFPAERFRESTIQRLCDSFITLLEDVVTRPRAPISVLQVLSPEERTRLVEWGGSRGIGTHDEGCIAALFERRVLERPSDVALVSGDDAITYGDLNAMSNRLGHKLRSLGCGENDVVAVLCERSPAAIVGIMAVQKVGAAHLPLDPHYPAARTRKMLCDSGARVLVADQEVSALHFSGTVIRADADLMGVSSANLQVSQRPESPAYVLYTSGTTGGAKGAMISQQNLVTLVHRATLQLSIDHRDVWTLFHSLCFDVSVWEMFGALLSGSRLVIVPRDIAAFPDRVLKLIEKNKVSVLCHPPSAFYLLADAMVRAEHPTSLRYVLLGGEAVKTEHLKQWSDTYQATLINGYGITETTIYSTFKTITKEDIRQRTGSIGHPLSHTYVSILDPDFNRCPIGVIGELYVGGLGVGLGYLGQPELTRSRFVDDPFQPGRLLYRSGDLARWLPNGEIEYIGREDTQVKLRGYRIELSEIEAAMTALSTIRESVVLAETEGNTPQLMGFFTSAIHEDVTRLRRHLEDQLPSYMVPARLFQIDRIPVTPNGKVDRAQLLWAREVAPPRTSSPLRSELEKVLSHTWAEILGISAAEIATGDSFFALGGDSIGANLVARLLSNRGLPVDLMDLFENPTLSALADVISQRNPEGNNDGQVLVSERIAYWDEMVATKLYPLFGETESSAGAEGYLMTTMHVGLGEFRPTRVGVEDTFELSEVFLTALSASLRMWSGTNACRIGVLERASKNGVETGLGKSLLVAPVVVAIKDINLGRENLATIRASVRRAANHRLTWDDAVANPAYSAAIENGVLFHFCDSVTPVSNRPPGDFEHSEADRQCIDPRTVPSGCLLMDCRASGSNAVVTFTAPAGATNTGRLQLLGEMFKLAFRETLRALPTAASPVRTAHVSLDVQPFRDVFFRDCTHQAVLAAVRYFGRDVHSPLANTMAVCVRDAGRPRGLRMSIKYLERRSLDEILSEAGISVHRSSANADICEQFVECLSEGAVGIVKIDCYFVERQRELFQKKHGEKTILICGFDLDRRLFEIIDNDGAGMQYRRTTIGFDELRAAYEGYQLKFNPRGEEVSSLAISAQARHHERQLEESALQGEVLETLRLTQPWRDEERAALALLHEDFCAASVSEHLLREHTEQLLFTFGELIMAKRLLSYQLGQILKHSPLARLVDEMTSRLEVVYSLLAKLRASGEYVAKKVQSMQSNLGEAQEFGLEFAESVNRLLEGDDVSSRAH